MSLPGGGIVPPAEEVKSAADYLAEITALRAELTEKVAEISALRVEVAALKDEIAAAPVAPLS
jgi:type II secretory pathway component PulM